MSQNHLTDADTGLKPGLAAALASLEVQLEQELTRYRRTRMGVKAANQPRVNSYANNYPQESPTRNATVADTPPAEIKLPINAIVETPPEIPVATITTAITDTPQIPPKPEANTQIPLPAASVNDSSMVSAIAQSYPGEKLLAEETPSQPDDYLESSEALLRSLTDEQPETTQPNNSSDSLLSPLGIGSMLLLLVASLTLGYVVFNPKSLPQLNFSKLFNSNSSPKAENPQTVADQSQPQLQPEPTLIPKYPNLAAKEFPEVRNPNDVVGLQPKVQPTPTALPVNPVPIQPLVIPPVASPVPQLQPLPSLNVSPKPQATATPSPANAEIKPSADGVFHIVVDNQGNNALTNARKIVPDAYLSRNSTLIYLATLKTKEEAQQRLKQLQAKGIKARVQQP
ncbi:hypothetical protein [Nostoc sp. TCL26-01]|uniref:hypothetical protein n=1 Tax=Nostoc sp. TCL26-01 TaxID=2576904 RepID=UPI0015B88DAB|nr:hypothetical protein [Nostoc sp. TCL26-01]QLE54110.1 hypothetical protein FD725_00345 [Nostoc sp. TCL26-01]